MLLTAQKCPDDDPLLNLNIKILDCASKCGDSNEPCIQLINNNGEVFIRVMANTENFNMNYAAISWDDVNKQYKKCYDAVQCCKRYAPRR